MINNKLNKNKSKNIKMIISDNYVEILKHEFDLRVQKNPRYSLRSFAKHLGISAASLSSVLSNKKGISEKVAKNICIALKFNLEESTFFCALVNSVDSRSREIREKNKKVVIEYLRSKKRIIITDESSSFISEIRNFVILELLKTSKISAPLSKNLLSSKMLGISTEEQKKIIDQAIDLGIVEIKNGYYKAKHETFLVPDHIAKESHKKIHFKALECARLAYENESYNEREFYFLITPLNRSKMDEIKKKIREFSDGLMYEYGAHESADAIYGFCTYLYPLEKKIP